jgi:uncharacterized OB-fold protein
MTDFNIPTTADIPPSRQCPRCGARHWLNYYSAELEEAGLVCGVCLVHYRDEAETEEILTDIQVSPLREDISELSV